MWKWIVTFGLVVLALTIVNWWATAPAAATTNSGAQAGWMDAKPEPGTPKSNALAQTVFWPVALLLGLSLGGVFLYRKAASVPVFIRRPAAPAERRGRDPVHPMHAGR